MLKRFIQFATGILLIAFLAFAVVLGFSAYKRSRAESLLRSIVRLQLGSSTFTDAQRLAEKYGGEPWNGPLRKAICSPQHCTLRFVFRNRPLSYFPGVRGVEFVTGMTVEDSRIVSREVDYSVLTRTGSYYDFMYLLDDSLKLAATSGSQVKRLNVDAQGTVHAVKVNLGPLATADERTRAYSINLSCLARLYGCDSPTAVFPTGLGTDLARTPGE
jgi:hypothetical protein